MEPLALLLYQKLLPGSQLVNRLQDLHYRVQSVGTASGLVELAENTKPMLILVDLGNAMPDLINEVRRLRENEGTRHLPVIAFGVPDGSGKQEAALAAGVTLVVSEAAILNHLPQCLSKALELD